MSSKITRSTVNDQQYTAPELPKSGFPLSYRRYTSFLLGRLHVGGFQFVMPGDKISGLTRGNNLTFKRLITPIVSPVNGMQYNIFIPFRPLDRTFQKGITPTKLNQMSVNWSAPMINTRFLVDQLISAFGHVIYNVRDDSDESISSFLGVMSNNPHRQPSPLATIGLIAQQTYGYSNNQTSFNSFMYDPSSGLVSRLVNSLTVNGTVLCNMADNLYLRDALIDIAENIKSKLGSIDNPISYTMPVSEFAFLFMDCIFTPFLGRYSYYGEFKYEFIRPWDLYRIAYGLTDTANVTNFSLRFSNTPLNEYPIRAMYAIWYELFRNVDLEPVSNSLPDWREFGSTSILDVSNGGNLLYLIYRIRSWEKDMFISAQIDDLSRHVYAPIYYDKQDVVAGHSLDQNNFDANSNSDAVNVLDGGSKPSLYTLSYRDQLSDTDKTIQCPVPSNV